MISQLTILILFLAIIGFTYFSMHVLALRYAKWRKITVKSHQVFLIKITLFFDVTLLSVLFFMYQRVELTLFTSTYLFMGFNLIAYCYFHFFNMSETARRIKILTSLKRGRAGKLYELSEKYDYESMLQLRLERLISLKQIVALPNGLYKLRSNFLYSISKLIILLRSIFGYGTQ